MSPVGFPEAKYVLAKDQPQYLPLAVVMAADGTVASCWRLTFWERVKLLWTGRVWVEVMTFHNGFPPIKPSIDRPDFSTYGKEE